jgi:four helix bundle protein
MNEKVRNYKDLLIWQKGIDLAKEIYKLTSGFPDSEKYGLSNQLRRAAVSIPSNIAEGHSRKSDKEFGHFLRIALGSCAEVDTQLIIAAELDYVAKDVAYTLSAHVVEIQKMIYGLISRINQ